MHFVSDVCGAVFLDVVHPRDWKWNSNYRRRHHCYQRPIPNMETPLRRAWSLYCWILLRDNLLYTGKRH